MYLYLAVLGLRCCKSFSSFMVSGGYSPAVMHGLLIVASPVAEHGFQGISNCDSQALERRLSSCGTRA